MFRKGLGGNFFALICNKTTYLLYGYQPSIVKKYILCRHYNNIHVDNTASLTRALTASYAISHVIAKHSKPFTDGEFVKKCLIAAVQSFEGSLTLEEAASIPLSKNTVKFRINCIASSLQDELKFLLECSFFSLCLDESTDNRHVSQLSIFARIVQNNVTMRPRCFNNFSYVEEFLDFIPLHGTTTGSDIFTAFNQTFEKFGTDFSRFSAVVTDGARAMTGLKTGLLGQIRQRDLKFPFIHCIIHQEAVCGKVVKLCSAIQMVTKIVNTNKGGHKFLSHRKFQHFLEEHNVYPQKIIKMKSSGHVQKKILKNLNL
ncbi:General transcription factor II-I repeat domain-containing protein 2B [Trachymyrmex zeteki]|uniref:General transcription factor II-I repeat domain-containing protein 2B n=1 Tax=Mycetomoellerius zeteki TaxID=64791 RepID=A0A151X1C4_9HYME|nr:General transcription factor II-I repeat domain-containing protein 2B [Trachymyrmex zeteki]